MAEGVKERERERERGELNAVKRSGNEWIKMVSGWGRSGRGKSN